jgi:hypothetical protein
MTISKLVSKIVLALALVTLCSACTPPQASQIGWENGGYSSVGNVTVMGPSAGIF